MLFLYEETGYIGGLMDILLKQLTGRTTVAHAVSYNNFDMCDHANWNADFFNSDRLVS